MNARISVEARAQPSSSPSTSVSTPEHAELYGRIPPHLAMAIQTPRYVSQQYVRYDIRQSGPSCRFREPISPSYTSMAPSNHASPKSQKHALIAALNERRVNTVGELRRIERIFASLGHSDLTEPMTSAWVHYVNSNSLLTELRGLTRNYPFSSECVEEAKRRVHQDPASNRSWNYCWLVLAKIHTDGLISTYAQAQAARPEMWGGLVPQGNSVAQLAQAFAEEWRAALAQLLQYWECAPIR